MEKSAPSLPESQHLSYLDGLRALAALWVVLYHTHLLIFTNHEIPWYLALFGWVRHGHSAVGLFIVISGFCLTIPVAKRKKMSPEAGVFFKRRALRILPPLYATLLRGFRSVSYPLALPENASDSLKLAGVTTTGVSGTALILSLFNPCLSHPELPDSLSKTTFFTHRHNCRGALYWAHPGSSMPFLFYN